MKRPNMGNRSPVRHYVFLTILLAVFVTIACADNMEYAPADGFRNNLGQPTLGIAGSNFVRASPTAYSDGAYEIAGKDRPEPMKISLTVHTGSSGEASLFSRNAFQAFYAQLVLDEVAVITPGCPPEYENLQLPPQHPLRNSTDRPQVYQRSGYDQSTGYLSGGPRQQTNLASSFLDGGVIYGTSQVWTSLLSSHFDGELLADNTSLTSSFPAYNDVKLPLLNAPIPLDHQMQPVSRLFRLGNPKGHENPFLLALQVVWFRWHNKVARDIKASNGNLTDGEIFQAARRKVVAHFQKIVVKDWLPAFLQGNMTNSTADVLPSYTKYDPREQPGITHEFLSAMDFRHTFTPAAVWNLNAQCKLKSTTGRDSKGHKREVTSLRLCNNFWDSQNVVKDNLELILRGMLYTLGERENGKFVSDFTKHFYGPFEYSRTDHVAAQTQRYRDHGLSGLNAIRQAYGLDALPDWTNLGGLNGTLQNLYGGLKPDNVDILTGGLFDETKQIAGVSDIFRKILVDQFTSLRDGDRFWYQRSGLFTDDEIKEIESITFRQILLNTTNLSPSEIPENVFLCTDSSPCTCLTPPNVDDETKLDIDVCSSLETHDYIVGSQVSFALSFLALALVVPVSYLILYCMVKKRKVVTQEIKKRQSTVITRGDTTRFAAREFLGKKSGFRTIKGEFKADQKMIIIQSMEGKILRYVSLKAGEVENPPPIIIHLSSDKDMSLLSVKVPEDIDLILDFADQTKRHEFIQALEKYLSAVGLYFETEQMSESNLYSKCMDKDERQKILDKFFRAVCLQIFEGKESRQRDSMGSQAIDDVRNIKLTITEFADSMGMQASSLFVKNMFMLANKDKDQFISFKEFIDLFGIFLKGTAEEKGHLLFNIYDIHQTGHLSRDEFHKMIKSILELAESPDLTDKAVNELVSSMFRYVGLSEGSKMTYEHFHKIFCADEYAATLQQATISGDATKHAPKATVARNKASNSKTNSFMNSYRARKPHTGNFQNSSNAAGAAQLAGASTRSFSLKVSARKMEYPGSKFGQRLHTISRFIDRYRLQIFWAVLYTLVTIGIFVERAYFFARGREHAGLRRLSGAWVTAMIRGSASVIMFTYSSLLITMCRNTITALRETFLHRFIPFDSAVDFHKYIAVLAIIGTIVHVVTHGMNLYCMCTQTTSSINCFFREYYTSSDSVATFHYWAFQTITGLAGVLVTVLIFVMYVFATQYSRRHVFKAFWFTHSLYWLVYVLTFLHGVGRLVQAPLFSWYLIGPLLLFVIDRLQSISRNKVEINVLSGTPLPSGVLRLVFKRPTTFSYRSGQWVRIACTEMSNTEYHPFTLTSAPHEPYLSLHIRAVGPWTTNLRKIYSQNTADGVSMLPNLYLDGPFGEGHQDWYNCEVAVLVGGGIGVTPFASILKDIAFRSKSGLNLTCKKVYFIWVTKTQKSFEWLVDIIRQVEKADVREIVTTHIFVTQFQQNYDLRTTMLYICERHFQKVEGQSLFTGLKAVTHFGRPQFEEFFFAITQEHKEVSQVGVFSCGPGPMTSNVQKACSFMNGLVGPTFSHHFENF